ncbi:hypothetical protein QAD02_005981 [Eretmocerus hayati]|uniref:Uncharacterized protein n=1 Tax=Eretmocerus hayati TaxID=131215 RepID=A0ACC2N014_9HYME|nr:hypothetical protein QAD02_005981 [Eretmocerus hayati]
MILSIHHRIANNPVDKTGLSHFHIACTRKKLNIVEHFIDLGVDIRFPKTRRRKTPSIFDLPETPEHKTAMDLAIRHERVEVVKLLLQYGALESSDDVEEFDHIKHAYSTGNMRIVELLIGESKLSHKTRKFETNYLALLAHGNHERLAKWACDTRSSLNLPITQSGCTLLHLAIEQGYRNICSFLVEQGSDFTIQDARGKSSLHLAFEHNWKELMDLMLKNRKKLSKNIIDSNGVSFLHIACARNDIESVKLLLEGDADVNAPVKSNAPLWAGYTPLHFTAKFGCEKVAYILLKSGASYTAVNASNLNAFDIALMEAKKTSSSGAFNCMKLLLISHRKFKDERFNDRGISLLHLASLKVSSKAHSYSTGLGELGQLLDTHARDINKAIHKMNLSWDGYTPLHFAVQSYETRDHANLLIRSGADVLAQDANGDTPMHLSERSMPFPDATFDRSDLRYLKLNHIGANGLSIFHTACIRGNLNLMKYFLDHGVDANCRTLFKGLGYEDEAPLHLVIRGSSDSSLDAVKLLLQYGADPNMNDFHKNTPLHLMHHCNRHPEIIELLVSNGADVNAYNARCDTPLLRLFLDLEHNFYKCSDFIRHIISFLNYGSNVDVENKKGATPFSIAYSGWGSLDPSDEQEWDDIVNIIDILLRHVIRLEIVGIHMSERNKDFNNLLLSTFSNELSFKKDSLIKVCKKELQLLRQIRKNNITYHDILLGNPHKLASISQNSLYQSIINSNAFCEKYPVYGPLVKSRLVEGKVRWRLLDESAKNLNIMLGITLPRICSDNILRYLDNQDLRNIFKSKKNAS